MRLRVRHSTYRDARGVAHSYFFSWEHQPTRSLEVDWLDARNICRRHCMDAVSLETPQVSANTLSIHDYHHLTEVIISMVASSIMLIPMDGCAF